MLDWTKTVQSPDGPETTNYEGLYNTGVYDLQGSASLTWYQDDWRVRWSTKYKGPIRVSLTDHDSWVEDMATNDENCASGSENCIANPEALAFNELGSYINHNISVSYSMDLDNDGGLRL